MKVYIAGPMRGYPAFNFPAFYDAEAEWAKRGWEVVNPARVDDHEGNHDGWAFADFMARDLPLLVHCDAIALLDGWENSQGARTERAVAKEMGLRIFDARFPAPLPVTDHQYTEGSYNAGIVVNECCDLPDYMHLPLWRKAS